jgi:hypothetical protein
VVSLLRWPHRFFSSPFAPASNFASDGIKRQPLEPLGPLRFLGRSNHGTTEICEQSKIWKGGGQEREERDAPREKRHAEVRTRRKRRNGQEPEAGDCDRSFRSPQERRESPSQGSVGGNCRGERLSVRLTTPPSILFRQGWDRGGDDERQNPKAHVARTAELDRISNSARRYCRSNRVLSVPRRDTLDSCSAEIYSKSLPFAGAQLPPHQCIG